jgi:hypothetical protein
LPATPAAITASERAGVSRAGARRGDQWYLKYRLPDGRQVQKKLRPAHTGRGRPPEGYLTKRAAQEALEAILTDARRGTLGGMTTPGATFAVAAEWLLRRARPEAPALHGAPTIGAQSRSG